MKNNIRKNALGMLNKSECIRDYKAIVLDFEEWINNTQAFGELRKMSTKEALGIVREVWEECKSLN